VQSSRCTPEAERRRWWRGSAPYFTGQGGHCSHGGRLDCAQWQLMLVLAAALPAQACFEEGGSQVPFRASFGSCIFHAVLSARPDQTRPYLTTLAGTPGQPAVRQCGVRPAPSVAGKSAGAGCKAQLRQEGALLLHALGAPGVSGFAKDTDRAALCARRSCPSGARLVRLGPRASVH